MLATCFFIGYKYIRHLRIDQTKINKLLQNTWKSIFKSKHKKAGFIRIGFIKLEINSSFMIIHSEHNVTV